MKRQVIVVMFFFTLLPSISHAETVYVTDLLRLNLHELPKSQGSILKTVISGEALEIVERQPGYAKVRTTDNIVGWTKSAYLVTDKPPRLIVTTMEKQLAKIKKQMKAASNKMKAEVKNAEKYKLLLKTHEATNKEQFTELEKLKLQNKEFEKSMRTYESSVPLNAYLISIVVFFIIGILLGWYIIDYRIRKRHGGFRIY